MGSNAEKIFFLLSVVLCFVLSTDYVEGKTSIVIKKLIPGPPPNYGDGVYARSFMYGGPTPSYRLYGYDNRSYKNAWKPRGRRENSLRNYASGFNTWLLTKDRYRMRDFKPHGKRRRPVHDKFEDNDVYYGRRPRRPYRGRIQGSAASTETDDFDSEDHFPEESKRSEAQHVYQSGRRPGTKTRRNPIDRRKKPKKPYLTSSSEDDSGKSVYEDDRKVFSVERPSSYRYKLKREPVVSYSSFIQHPSSSQGELDYDYIEDDSIRPPVNLKKKRRIKKKTKVRNEELENFQEENYHDSDNYFQYYIPDEDYQTSVRNTVDELKYKPEQVQKPIYGDGHVSNSNVKSIAFPSSNSFTPSAIDDYGSQQSFNWRSQPQIQSITNPSQAYRSSYQTSYSQPVQYSNVGQQSTNFGSTNYGSTNYGYSSGSRYSYTKPTNSYETLVPDSSTYQTYQRYQQQQPSSAYYAGSSSTYNKEVSTTYSSNPVHDNTDTYRNFNSNAQSRKPHPTYSSKYSERGGGILSYRSTEKPDDEEFLRKHQNLYNNGISGVPIQGDGYSKEVKNDYDIGYGEYQFDENP